MAYFPQPDASEFGPTEALRTSSGGAASQRWVRVAPDSAAIGAAFQGSVQFSSYKGSAREYVNPAESYISMALKFETGLGGPLVVGDNVAPARYAPSLAFNSITTNIAGSSVDITNHPARNAMLSWALTRSEAYAETSGALELASASFADRQALAIGGAEIDFKLSPSTPFWSADKRIPGVNLDLMLNVESNWRTRVAESTGAAKVPGVDYNVEVVELSLWLSVYTAEEGVAPKGLKVDVVDSDQINWVQTNIAASLGQDTNIGLNTNTHLAAIVFQPTDAGINTLHPITSYFDSADLNTYRIDYAAQSYPPYAPQINFTTGRGVGREYNSYASQTRNYIRDGESSGSLYSLNDFTGVSGVGARPIFIQRLISPVGSNASSAVFSFNSNTAYTGSMWTASAHAWRLVLAYGPDGMIQKATQTTSAAQLKAAYAAAEFSS